MAGLERVVLVGGTGFLGRHAGARLAARGIALRIVSRRPDAAPPLPAEVVAGDVLDPPSIAAALAGMDAAMNFVGIMRERGRYTYEAVHVDGARAVAEAARQAGLSRLLHLSALGIAAHAPARTDRTKAAGEHAVRQAFPDATLVRPSVVYGLDDHFLTGLARLAAKSPAIPLIGGGATLFQPIHIADAADALVAALEDNGTKARAVSLAGPDTLSLRQIVEVLLRTLGRRRALLPVPSGIAGGLARLASLVPGEPPLTVEEVRVLRTAKTAGAADLMPPALGIRPRRFVEMVPALVRQGLGREGG